MVGFYVASKVKHANKWLALRNECHYAITSSWIDEAGEGETACYQDLCRRCVREVCISGAVLCYVEEGELVKGALVEVGVALAVGIPVFLVAPRPDQLGSWINHPRVMLCPNVQDALARIRNL